MVRVQLDHKTIVLQNEKKDGISAGISYSRTSYGTAPPSAAPAEPATMGTPSGGGSYDY